MRLIALTVIAMTFTMAGLLVAYRFNKRVIMLEKCIVMVNSIQAEIEFLLKPSSEIVCSLAERKDLEELKFLKVCNFKISEGTDFQSAWRESVNQKDNSVYLNNSDIMILNSFGELFGVTGRDGQYSNCKLYYEKFQSALNEARHARDKYSKLFSSIGLLAGMYFIIVFI